MLMQIDGTILFVIISFLIFLFIIKTILFHPFSKIIDERNNFYTKNSKMENESKEKSKKLIEDKENKLNESKKEAIELLKNTNEKSKLECENYLKEAKNKGLDAIKENKTTLETEKNATKQKIKKEINNIVSKIAEKVLDEKIEINLDDNQINQYLKI